MQQTHVTATGLEPTIHDKNIQYKQTHGLKTLNCTLKIKEMVSFEQDLWDLVTKIKFRKISSNFQNQLKEDIKAIKKSKKALRFCR